MRVIGVGLLTGLLGAVLALLAANLGTKLHHMSDFEGARGYAIVFLFTPAGFVVGLALGVVLAKLAGPAGLGGFGGQLGGSLLLITLVVGLALGMAYLSAPRQPLVDGKPLVLDFELKLPEGRALPAESEVFRVSLYAGDKDNQMTELHRAAVSSNAGRVIIPGSAALNTTTARRMLVIDEGKSAAIGFDLPLRASPRPSEDWSEWMPTGDRFGGFQVRYRIRKL